MTLRQIVALDVRRWFHGSAPSRSVLVWNLVLFAGLRAVVLMRLQALLWDRGWRWASKLLYAANAAWHGVEFLPGCRIGPGLLVRHPVGVVVGQGVILGSNCTLLQGVTLGERRADGGGDHLYPTVYDGVVIGAQAVVLGGVTLGHGATVGAGAVVLVDVPPSATAVGNPARLVRGREDSA